MKAAWGRWVTWFDGRVPRERGLLSLAVLGGIAVLMWALFIDPAQQQSKGAARTIAAQQAQLQLLQAQVAAMQAPGSSPEEQARAEIEVLKAQLVDMEGRLAAMEGALVPPQRMAGLLESMIGGRSGLRLVSLRTLPVTSVLERKETDKGKLDAATGDAAGGAGGLYKHGVELTLEGGYAELTDYLARLEQLSQKLLWSSVSLSAEKHPKLVLKLTVFTLSLDRAWLAF